MTTVSQRPALSTANPKTPDEWVQRAAEVAAILAVDDEPAVLAAVARDLRRGFGERYRILRAGSGADATALWVGLHGLAHQHAVTTSYPWPADIVHRIAAPLSQLVVT